MYKSISIILYKSNKLLTNNHVLQYPTLGNYDYIGIESKDDVNYSSECRFDNSLEQDFYSIHKFYASLHEGNDFPEEFFDYKSPYMFVSMIHFNYNRDKKTIDQFLDYNQCIKKILDGRKYIVYDSFDCCDVIIFLKSDNYKSGMNDIQKLDLLSEIKYSYSIMSYDNEIIQSDDYKDEEIDKVTICGIINHYDSFSRWNDEINKEFKTGKGQILINNYGRIGNEDVVINIKNINAKSFFENYYNSSGYFNNSNKLFNNSLMYSRIHIDDLSGNFYGVSSKEVDGINLELKQKFIEACTGLEPYIDESIKKAAIQVLNSCDYLSRDNFALDIRDCIKKSSDMFINKVKCYRLINNQSGYDIIHYNESIKKYTSGIMSIVNGSLQADRMFFQVPGFNAVLYDIPSKLIVLYTAFVYKIANVLNDIENNSFAFLVCPDLYQYTHISKLFDEKNKDGDLLLKVRIPINSLFNSKMLLLELTHEVAHYIGKSTRTREFRGSIEINMLSVELLKHVLKVRFEINSIKIGEEIHDTLHTITVNNIKKYVNEEKDKLTKDEQEYFYYQSNYKDFLLRAICRTLNDKGYLNDIFENISSSLDIFDIDFDDYYKIRKCIDENIGIVKVKCSSIIDGIHELQKESYADLIMIQTLGISLEEYVLTFFRFLPNPTDVLSKNNIGERISSILFAFDKKTEDLDQLMMLSIINENKFFRKDNIDYISEIKKYVVELKKYTRETKEIPEDKSDVFALFTKKFNALYLKECKNAFDIQYSNCNEIKEIRNIYNELEDNNILNHITIIRELIAEFRDDTFLMTSN